MYCKNCGNILNQGERFCGNCGTKVEDEANTIIENNPIQNNSIQNNPIQNNPIQNNPVQNNSFQFQQGTDYQMNGTNFGTQGSTFNTQQPLNQNTTNYNNNYNQNKNNKKGIIFLIIGIIAVLVIVILIISGIGKKSENDNLYDDENVKHENIKDENIEDENIEDEKINNQLSSKTFYGDVFKFKYNEHWSINYTSNGAKGLLYKDNDLFLLPTSTIKLSDFKIDFNSNSGKYNIYKSFYDLWNSDVNVINNETIKITGGSNGFEKFNDDLYYATYNFGKNSYNETKGKYFLIVDEEKDLVLMFMVSYKKNEDSNVAKAMEILKTIEITKQTSISKEDYTDNSSSNSDFTNEYLNEMSNWNLYSYLRKGNLGKINDIDGGWRVLADTESYWKFENGKFWWYKSVNDLNDNYWYGTAQILTGKTGLALVGISESKLNNVIASSGGKITEDDVYTVICTPTKLINDGVDKSSTNIVPGKSWKYIWVLIDHGAEGIEGQMVNLDTAESLYYLKIED